MLSLEVWELKTNPKSFYVISSSSCVLEGKFEAFFFNFSQV